MTNSSRISFVTASSKRTRLDEIAGLFGKNRSDVINEALDQYILIGQQLPDHQMHCRRNEAWSLKGPLERGPREKGG